ncbi:MAG TPA: GNAT family N-acetyltransferase [Steroidobacteraceae bacterium]|nr:GNAT family N-acetyltransferase [Steroidobacteraceae bacterium]
MSAAGAEVLTGAVRRAEPADAASLSLLGSATFLESYAHLLPVGDILAHTAKQHAPAQYARWLEDADAACWLAEHDTGGAPLGYAVATPPDLPLPDLGPGDLEIRRIYVLHRYQGSGLGRRLMQSVDAHAAAIGASRLLLGVYSRNEAALAFYARQGFVRAGTRQFRVGAHDYFDYILQRIL